MSRGAAVASPDGSIIARPDRGAQAERRAGPGWPRAGAAAGGGTASLPRMRNPAGGGTASLPRMGQPGRRQVAGMFFDTE